MVAYQAANGKVVPVSLAADTGKGWPEGLVWIDMVAPNEGERALIESWTGVALPTADAMRTIAASKRFRRRGSAVWLITPLLVNDNLGLLSMVPVAFILTGDLLITLRDSEPDTFTDFAAELEDGANEQISPEDMLIGLIETAIGQMADAMQATARELGPLSRWIFMTPGTVSGRGRKLDRHLQAILRQLGRIGDRAAVALYGVCTLDPLPEFLRDLSHHGFTEEQQRRINLIDRDIAGLERAASHATERVQVLLNAALGMISIRQTAINKVLSVVATVALPPTLIGTIYGMNFQDMPELGWALGYPLALGLMAVTAILPYLIIKWRGWL